MTFTCLYNTMQNINQYCIAYLILVFKYTFINPAKAFTNKNPHKTNFKFQIYLLNR